MISVSAISKSKAILLNSQKLLFITGAGVSADSGLPTYRGVSGLYEAADTDDGVSIEEALSGPMFAKEPLITWKYLLQIAHSCQGKGPNRAHEVIAELDAQREVCVITQNIDGFHTRAGSKNVIEMHGNMQKLLCTQCAAKMRVSDYSDFPMPPLCSDCGGMLRPDVVLFGEMLSEKSLARYYEELAKGFDAVFIVGTTSVFPYITAPVQNAIATGVPTIEINPSRTHLSDHVTLHVPARAAVYFEALGLSSQ